MASLVERNFETQVDSISGRNMLSSAERPGGVSSCRMTFPTKTTRRKWRHALNSKFGANLLVPRGGGVTTAQLPPFWMDETISVRMSEMEEYCIVLCFQKKKLCCWCTHSEKKSLQRERHLTQVALQKWEVWGKVIIFCSAEIDTVLNNFRIYGRNH